jgi:hypothetical protein
MVTWDGRDLLEEVSGIGDMEWKGSIRRGLSRMEQDKTRVRFYFNKQNEMTRHSSTMGMRCDRSGKERKRERENIYFNK